MQQHDSKADMPVVAVASACQTQMCGAGFCYVLLRTTGLVSLVAMQSVCMTMTWATLTPDTSPQQLPIEHALIDMWQTDVTYSLLSIRQAMCMTVMWHDREAR